MSTKRIEGLEDTIEVLKREVKKLEEEEREKRNKIVVIYELRNIGLCTKLVAINNKGQEFGIMRFYSNGTFGRNNLYPMEGNQSFDGIEMDKEGKIKEVIV